MNVDNVLKWLENAKEFAYYPDPLGIGNFLKAKYGDKKVALYRNSDHSRKVASIFESAHIIADSTFEQFISMDDFKLKKDKYDFLILLGWWPNLEYDNFCMLNDLDHDFVLRPYHDEEFIKYSRSVQAETIDNISLEISNEKPNILLFISGSMKDFVTRYSSYLRSDFNLIKVALPSREKYSEDNSNFTQTIFLDFNIHLFPIIVSKFSNLPGIVVVALPSNMHGAIMYVKEKFPNVKIVSLVTETYNAVYGGQEEYSKKRNIISDEEYLYRTFCEDYLFEKSDGIITNHGGVLLEKLHKKYNRDDILFLEYPFGITCSENIQTSCVKQKGESYSFVYAGGVVNYPMLPDNYCEEETYLVPVFENILKQDFRLDCYFSSGFIEDLDAMYKSGQFSHYFELGNIYKNFNVKPTLSHINHVEEMIKYDFGLMLYNYTDNNLNYIAQTHAGFVHAKLFSYLAAGIPVIISKELHCQAEIVSRNNLGIVVDKNEISQLKYILKDVDYCAIKSSVNKFVLNSESINVTMSNKISDLLLSVLRKSIF